MTLAYDLPRIGRYRLYDRAGKKGTLWRCRLCGRSLKVDSLWVHYALELEKSNIIFESFTAQDIDEFRIRLATALLRSRRNLRRARWEFKVGRGGEDAD
jgi:hypothetical protein